MTSVSASRTAAMLEELGSLELLVRVLSRLSVKHDRLSQLAFSAALSCLSNIAVRGTLATASAAGLCWHHPCYAATSTNGRYVAFAFFRCVVQSPFSSVL
ncbi:hypothetical protein BSLG_001589 [Batrachochytrium salamandrivorans]|nr:hypothetical protein BSLG_001589 [Batrachochytrium salamandrivorans]